MTLVTQKREENMKEKKKANEIEKEKKIGDIYMKRQVCFEPPAYKYNR